MQKAPWLLVAGSLALAAVIPVQAQVVVRRTGGLRERVVAPAAYVATVVPQDLAAVDAELDPATRGDVEAFRAAAGPDWTFRVDRRSGGMALVEGEGIPWIDPGDVPTVDALAVRARDLAVRYPGLFRVDAAQLVLDGASSRQFGEEGQFWQIVFGQSAAGLRVAGARVVFRVAWGRLVQFGVDRTIPSAALPATRPAVVPAASAKAALAAHVGGLDAMDRFFEDGVLEWIPAGAGGAAPWTGPIGAGWSPVLAYRFAFTRPAENAADDGTWQALVEARSGRVVRFLDARIYAKALAKGGVHTHGNCTDARNCTPGDAPEVTVTVPFTRLTFTGAPCQGDGCFTNGAGAFEYPPGATAAATSLSGKYFAIEDQCGPLDANATAPADLDLGTTPPAPTGFNTDCAVATQQSPPGTGALSGGAGDTHAARACYFHLNLIGEKARVYLPSNDWLKGLDGTRGTVPVRTNLPAECNAYWSPGAGSLNFQKVSSFDGCNNTGEIPDIILHEFGHGLDQNDASGTAPEGGTGEAMGDSFALLQGQHSCIGPGFRMPGLFGSGTAGYGSKSLGCTGVRDIDYTRFCWRGFLDECNEPPDDPDAPNGSRSGTAPPPNPPDAGTPARWDTMVEDAWPGVADGISNFYTCGGPEGGGCAGPLNHGCHCESLIASQANWDLAKLLIGTVFGGDIYAVPQGPREVAGWQLMDRLWYLTRDLAISAYSATGPAPEGTTNGCGVDNWWATYRLVDDDDGNLANGTPHAAQIFAALDLHGIACGAAADPANQSTGCPAPLAAPALSTCNAGAPVALSWTGSPGAESYRVLRNTVGCGYGFTPLATLPAQTFFEDADVAPGVPYYYSVQPVGAPSCHGITSNCLAVTPAACPPSTLPAPVGISATAQGGNQVAVSWTAVPGAASYKILRRGGDCAAGGAYLAIATVPAPATSFLDTIDLHGTRTYSYTVAASPTACGSCSGTASACASTTATGQCGIAPRFGGLSTIDAGLAGACRIALGWAAGTPECGTTLTYTVHRGTDPFFTPNLANRVASDITGTSFTDHAAGAGTRYWYIVRARDAYGNSDPNEVRMGETPGGPTAPGTFADDAGDTGAAKFRPSPTRGNRWSIRAEGTGNATRQYATTAAGNHLASQCAGLESDTLFLGGSPTLSFRTRYDLENGYDAGYVEVSTEAGGFRDWSKLDSIAYPGTMTDPQVAPACGGAGFADGAPVFTGLQPDWTTVTGSLAAYANQAVRLRFLFSSDPGLELEGWFVDDVAVSDVRLPAACLPEVSRADSGHPLRVRRNGVRLDLFFEDLGAAATAYDVYEGALGTWYGHTATRCHDKATVPNDPAPGDRALRNYQPAHANAYLLVNAVNATAEGVAGIDSTGNAVPLPAGSCGPTP